MATMMVAVRTRNAMMSRTLVEPTIASDRRGGRKNQSISRSDSVVASTVAPRPVRHAVSAIAGTKNMKLGACGQRCFNSAVPANATRTNAAARA